MSAPVYPMPGTHGDAVLVHIRSNPGCSQNAATRAAGGDHRKAKHVVIKLVRHGLVTITTDERGYHSLWPTPQS